MPGFVPKVISGLERGGVDRHARVEARALIAPQHAPASERGLPGPPLRRAGRGHRGTAKVVSSGAIMPARAPASMDMLQTVMRASMAERADGLARVLDDVAGAAADAQASDDGEDRGPWRSRRRRSRPSHGTSMRPRPPLQQALGGEDVRRPRWSRCRRRSAPNAPWVLVWLSPQTMVLPGWVRPELRADDVDDALVLGAQRMELDAGSRGSSAPACRSCVAALGVGDHHLARRSAGVVGRGVIHGGEGQVRAAHPEPAAAEPVNACGEVTSWTRCRSTKSTAGASAVSGRTRWLSQIWSNNVRGRSLRLLHGHLRERRAPARRPAGGDAVDHLEVGLGAGDDDVGVHPAAAEAAAVRLDVHRGLALRVLTDAHAADLQAAQPRVDPGDPVDALEDRVDRSVAGRRRLLSPATVPLQTGRRRSAGVPVPEAAVRLTSVQPPSELRWNRLTRSASRSAS